MLVLLGALLTLAASSEAVPCPDYCEVVSSVFQPNVSVNFSDAQLVCECYKADLANLEQVTRMHNHSYQSCSWAWVKEQKMVMLRNEVDNKCGNSSTGVLHKAPCVHIGAQSAVCFKRNVVKGVFQVYAETNKTEGSRVCGTFNATWATWDQMDTANSSGYATCSAGWVANVTQYKFMDLSGLNCTNGTGTNETDSKAIAFFCFRAALMYSGLYPVFPPSASQLLNKTEAKSLCVSLLGNLATDTEIKNSNRSSLPRGLTAWYQDGIIQQSVNGTMEEVPCVNYPHVNGSVFCYKANLADAVCADTTWKKIAMGCILASIFAILLIAAVCMRGNQFICCLDKPHLVSVGNSIEVRRVAPREPTWNTTGIYTSVKDVLDPAYNTYLNVIPEPRLPAIRPEMLIYRSHPSFVMPRPDGPATLHGQSRVYDNLGYDASDDQ
ncbi:hypothetical protein NDU88_007442 [Pleurodeles waltl]|uniref:Link domain-containing protein n=1 Tax=Pleurodeles waltl TaxID=8319 RepID=A0AAV7U0G2_PLEWA|nr:hypothetical protein NDU88_007442 [Pleurodeles waltl]